jgi:hypothetical protein
MMQRMVFACEKQKSRAMQEVQEGSNGERRTGIYFYIRGCSG